MSGAPGSRFGADAAGVLRAAIREAGGVEVFAIGDVTPGPRGAEVTALVVSCRGTADSVPALLERPRAGQVVIHNHPSGDLRPSEPDLQLAHLWGEDGVGVVIVDSAVTRSNWVVEPHAPRHQRIDRHRLRAFFLEDLPRAVPGWESRPQQLEMAMQVADTLDDEVPLLVEAGTGTGKSLAYLVPAALHALANDTKVAVSTYTKALQAQLVGSDLPLLARGGLEVRTAVLQGRNNYLCKRRLGLALADLADPPETRATLEALRDWSATTRDGARTDLGFAVDGATWERVMSDADLTLSIRCDHYAGCHWYETRRAANAAHLLVVNHALLLSDLAIRGEAGRGFLPKYQRVVVDEAHHLEDAATGIATERLARGAIERATWSLLDGRGRQGALSKLQQLGEGPESPLPEAARRDVGARVAHAESALSGVRAGAALALGTVADAILPTEDPVRVGAAVEGGDPWRLEVAPTLRHLAHELGLTAAALERVLDLFQDAPVAERDAEPLMVLTRAHRRLSAQAGFALAFLGEAPEGTCRWIEPDRATRGERTAAPSQAPVAVDGVLRRRLWDDLPGVVLTSATLTVAGRFDHLARRVGLAIPHRTAIHASPFDHARQAVLALPRDLVSPEDPGFLDDSARVVVDAVGLSDGGAFVLCTSHAAVRAYAGALRRADPLRPLFVQGEAGRAVLLDRFRENRRAVLVGTDSFWEGVSVKGDGLRLVIIPRLPFRVPTEPLQAARLEAIAASGADPFRTYTLPEAVLKLRQGYGRLIRSRSDTGVVLLCDRRLHDRAYGRIVLGSLPPARRVAGPWEVVRRAVAERLATPGQLAPGPGGRLGR